MTPPLPETPPESMDVSYGDLSLSAKGSIVVLVILLAGNGAFTLMTYAWITDKIDAVVEPQNGVLTQIMETQHKHRGEQGSENRLLDAAIVRNRDYLREIGRVCMYSETQKQQFQNRLSPAMRELLFNEKER